MANANGFPTNINAIAELGPGDSLGTGIAGLISGANRYYALDVIKLSNTEQNLSVYEELVKLFDRKENIPDEIEFPQIKPYLRSYKFPSDILTNDVLERVLRRDRLTSIRNAIVDPGKSDRKEISITYIVPWSCTTALEEYSVDMVFSQAVLEYVEDLRNVYEIIYKWLKTKGFMSHTIGFTCHNTAKDWDGHWAYSDLQWKIIKGRRPLSINREPYSTHIRLIKEVGFEIICDVRIRITPKIETTKLAPRFKKLSYDDRSISGTFIQAIKPQFRVPMEE